MDMNLPLESGLCHELRHGLREVTAPPELWDRVRAAKAVSSRENNRTLVWAMAAAVVVMAVGLSLIHRDNVASSPLTSDHCQNPAQLRAWVRAKTGLDLPLRADSSPSIQLISARNEGGRVEIAYRAGNRDATLLVSRADAGSRSAPHNRVNGNVSSWVMDGQRLTLACADPAALQLACKLCHLD
jgi:hypothetical protein